MLLQQGSIVWVSAADQAGRNHKCRPAVIVTPTDEIGHGNKIVAVAATGTFSRPLAANRIEIPWHRGRHPITGLYKPCVAVCDWLIEFEVTAVEGHGGVVPRDVLRKILSMLPPDPLTEY